MDFTPMVRLAIFLEILKRATRNESFGKICRNRYCLFLASSTLLEIPEVVNVTKLRKSFYKDLPRNWMTFRQTPWDGIPPESVS
jgi:hypothetical protein